MHDIRQIFWCRLSVGRKHRLHIGRLHVNYVDSVKTNVSVVYNKLLHNSINCDIFVLEVLKYAHMMLYE